MADGIHRPVHAMEPPHPESVVNRVPPEAGRHELGPADDAVLRRCEGRDSPIGDVLDAFCPHSRLKVSSARDSPLRCCPSTRFCGHRRQNVSLG